MGWHDITLSEVASQLKTDTAVGLTSAAARQRAKKYGRNRYEPALKPDKNPILKAALRPGTLVFAVAAAFCAIADRKAIWAVLIVAVALTDLVFSLIRNGRERQIRMQLAGSIRQRATLVRDGNRLEAHAEVLVPGDLIFVTAGDVIPADARLVASSNLFCDESALFGVGRLTKKDQMSAVREDDPIDERTNMIYCGCGVTEGNALAIVTETGKRTEFARLRSRTVSTPEKRPPLEKMFYSNQTTFAVTASILGTAALLLPKFFPDALTYSGAFSTVFLAVGIALNFGPAADMRSGLCAEALESAGSGMTFRNPADIEKCAEISMVCSDIDVLYAKKRMRVVKVWTQLGAKNYDPNDEDQAAVLRLAALGLGCEFDGDDVPVYRGRDAKTKAILTAVEENGGLFKLFSDFNRALGTSDGEITAAAVIYGKVKLAVAVGSAETLLIHCDEPLLDAREAAADMERGAAEVIVVAVKKLRADTESEPEGFMAAGMIAVQNELSAGLTQYCDDLYQNGITPVILTAKSKTVTEAYGRALGVLCADEKVAAAREANIADPAVRAYADCSVRDCIKIIKSCRSRGENVSVIGSECAQNNLLEAADLGVAASDACDMIRNHAGLVLSADTNREFSDAVKKSRRCITAVKNSALFGTAAAGAIFSTLIIIFLSGRAAFEQAAALLVFAAVKFLLIPKIQRQEFKGVLVSPGAKYNRRTAMHALLVSIYLTGASIGCSFLGAGSERAGSFIALACGTCIAGLCFCDEKTLLGSAIFSNRGLLISVTGTFWAFALFGYLLLEPGAPYPFLALAAAVCVLPFSEITKWILKRKKDE